MTKFIRFCHQLLTVYKVCATERKNAVHSLRGEKRKAEESRLAQRTQNHQSSQNPNQDSRDVTDYHHEDHGQNCDMHKTGPGVKATRFRHKHINARVSGIKDNMKTNFKQKVTECH